MILDALQYMLFGMVGIFIVMGVIMAVVMLLKKAFKGKDKKNPPA